MTGTQVQLRDVTEVDLPILFEHQLDEEAASLIGFAPRDWDEFRAHWLKLLGDRENIKRTITYNGQVAGNVLCFWQSGEREVGYWLGREFWNKGIATKALSLLLEEVKDRPLFAHVAKHNVASRRVLEKCGFIQVSEDKMVSEMTNEVIEEFVMRLDGESDGGFPPRPGC